MTYNPKERPTYLGPAHLRETRTLTQGHFYVADNDSNNIPPIPKAPTPIEQALAVGKVVALVLAAAAGSLVAAASSGAAIPAWLLSIATAIVAIAAPLGIASGGVQVKKKDELP